MKSFRLHSWCFCARKIFPHFPCNACSATMRDAQRYSLTQRSLLISSHKHLLGYESQRFYAANQFLRRFLIKAELFHGFGLVFWRPLVQRKWKYVESFCNFNCENFRCRVNKLSASRSLSRQLKLCAKKSSSTLKDSKILSVEIGKLKWIKFKSIFSELNFFSA